MKASSIFAAALLAVVPQVIAAPTPSLVDDYKDILKDVSCYDNGWDVDVISADTMKGAISNYCKSSLNKGLIGVISAKSIGEDGKKSDYAIDLTTTNWKQGDEMSEDTCNDLFNRVVSTCVDRKSGGDFKHFKGGAVMSEDEKYSVTIECDNKYCKNA